MLEIELSVVLVSGELVLGPTSVDSTIQVRALQKRIDHALQLAGHILTLIYGEQTLAPRQTLAEIGVENGAVLTAVIEEATWPVPTYILWRCFEADLEPYLERLPRWEQLRGANSKVVDGFVRGFLKQLPPTTDTSGLKFTSLLARLGFEAKEAVTIISAELLERGAKLTFESAAEVTAFVQDLCSSASVGSRRRRLLIQWPKGTRLRQEVALLVASAWCEERNGDIVGTAISDDIDASTQSVFHNRPDFPAIRRYLLEAQFVRIQDGQQMYMNHENLNAAWLSLGRA